MGWLQDHNLTISGSPLTRGTFLEAFCEHENNTVTDVGAMHQKVIIEDNLHALTSPNRGGCPVCRASSSDNPDAPKVANNETMTGPVRMC
jgi:hypothetical protein